MAFTFVGLHNKEDELIEVNAYHIMTMQRMGEREYRGSVIPECTEIQLVNGEVLTVAELPTEIRTLISMNGRSE